MIDLNGVTICASKYFNADEMRMLYQKQVFHFGENRAQDLLTKKEELKDWISLGILLDTYKQIK
jgi:uncharacterized pyridoxal phosphate-containing UPF0001 family protein